MGDSLYGIELMFAMQQQKSVHPLFYLPILHRKCRCFRSEAVVPLRSHSDLFFVSIFLVTQILSSGVSPRRDILTCPATSPLLTNALTLDALPRICNEYHNRGDNLTVQQYNENR